MLRIMLDGLSILYNYLGGILVFYVGILGFGFLAFNSFVGGLGDRRIRFLAALGVGPAVLCVFVYILVFLSRFWPFLLQPGSYAILLVAVYSLLKEFRGSKWQYIRAILTGGALIFVIQVIRLAFLRHVLLPSYSDSPIHYQIVTGFLHPGAKPFSKLSFETLLTDYYHFGFHSLVTWLATITHYDPADTISLLGQLFLVIAPVSIFFLVYVLTNNGVAALFAGLLAAIGWDMPAFAVNWGKFPAIGSLAILPSIVALLGMYFREPGQKRTGILWLGVLIAGVALIHTRVVVCILLIMISFMVARALPVGQKLNFTEAIRYSVLYLVSLWPLLSLLSDFYARTAIAIVLLVLLPFAFLSYPRLALEVFLFTFGLWLITIVPPLITDNPRTLLDKQFLEIMLYIPFSLLGGAGFAGLMNQTPPASVLQKLMNVVLFGSVIISFLPNNSVYPDSCCNYFSEDDRIAFQWLQDKATDHTLVLIAAFEDNGRVVGTDAGMWLFPLIGQPTNRLPFNLNWDSSEEFDYLCQLDSKEIFIYAGGRNYSFNSQQLSRSRSSKLTFESGETQIYQVAKCSK